MKKLDDNALEQINGGTMIEPLTGVITQDEKARYEMFRTAWEALGFSRAGHTPHERDELFEGWKASKYQPSAMEFLRDAMPKGMMM